MSAVCQERSGVAVAHGDRSQSVLEVAELDVINCTSCVRITATLVLAQSAGAR